MVGHRSKKQGVAVMVLGGICALVAAPKDADACGACFTSATESTVVNDHKMALKITNQETVLWDQISYTGNPKEFAYVIPARPGTRLEASNDGFFAALDLTTRPIIMSPQPASYGGGGGGYYGGGGGSGGGCGCGSDDSLSSAYAEGANAGGAMDAGSAPPPVQIVAQAVVGPYQTVTLRSTEPKALQEWLDQNGYAMPDIADPIIEQYVTAKFDFIAMRLAPGANVRSMKPIRIVSPTPDPELPLRMMQIGAGSKVGITLYVLAEGRYQPKNFPLAKIDESKLIWDYAQSRSNYQELSLAAMNASDGRAMLVEFANRANMTDTGATYQPQYGGGMGANPSLPEAYRATCKPDPNAYTPPGYDASTDEDAASDAATDAMIDDAGSDAEVDGGEGDVDGGDTSSDAGITITPVKECDDLDSLTEGLVANDLWVTRIRANLPNAALADTLLLEAAPQEPVDNVHQVTSTGSITARIARARVGGSFGSAAIIAGTVFFFSRIVRRRRHQSKS